MVESMMNRMPMNDGFTIPILGLGTSGLKGPAAEEAVYEALMKGYRLIDTAAWYENEEAVGKAISRAISNGVSREDIFVITKVWKTEMGFQKATRSFEDSLTRLDLSYVDLLLIHWPDKEDAVNVETWKALEELQESGRVRSIGVSNFTKEHLLPLLKEGKVRPAVNQYESYPGSSNSSLKDYCDSENIVSIAYSPIKRGEISEENHIASLSEKYNKTPAQIALKWHIQRNVIPIPKSGHTKHIRENTEIFDFLLSEEEMHFLNQLDGK